MAVKIIRKEYEQYRGNVNGRDVCRLDISVPTTSELPTAESIDGIELAAPSFALIEQTGEMAVYSQDGSWYIGESEV